jgi:hypothetical protein
MKHLFLVLCFAAASLLAFSQSKGKNKSKSGNKQSASSTIPNPGNPSVKPEVKQKQMPPVYDAKVQGSPAGNNGSSVPVKDTGKVVGGVSSNPGTTPAGDNPPVTGTPTGSPETKPTVGSNTPAGDDKGEKGKKEHKGDKGDKEWKNKEQQKHEGDDKEDDHDGNGNDKERDHVPSRVEKAFKVEYPAATNAVWTKQNGDWTVTFNNNGSASTATYHSNGEKPSGNMPGKKKEIKEKKDKKSKG